MGPDRHSLHPGSLTCPSEGWGQRGGCVRDRVRGRCVWGRCVCGDGVCGTVCGDGVCGGMVCVRGRCVCGDAVCGDTVSGDGVWGQCVGGRCMGGRCVGMLCGDAVWGDSLWGWCVRGHCWGQDGAGSPTGERWGKWWGTGCVWGQLVDTQRELACGDGTQRPWDSHPFPHFPGPLPRLWPSCPAGLALPRLQVPSLCLQCLCPRPPSVPSHPNPPAVKGPFQPAESGPPAQPTALGHQ